MPTLSAPRPPQQSRKSRKAQPRSIRVLSPGRIVIRVGNNEDEYAVTEFQVGGAYDGRAFRCERFGGDTYDVFLSRNGQDDTCDCRGFEAHSRCKHRDGLRALLTRGLLDNIPSLSV